MSDVRTSFADLKRSANQMPPTRRMRPRYRFRAAVRQVINNLEWLADVDEDDAAGGKAKMNVIMLRGKNKAVKSGLAMQDKALLMKPVSQRSEADKIRLFNALSELGNFRRNRYPEAMQRQLATNTHFSCFGANRVIIRQGHPPQAFYFLVEGEVEVSIKAEDPITHRMVDKVVGTMVAGDMFGEVGLLHRMARTATITSATSCSLVWLWRDDFEIIIRQHLAAKWDEATMAMRSLPYFDKWDDKAIQESCVLNKIQAYQRDEVVFGDGIGYPKFVYFIITGECRIVEGLQVIASTPGSYVSSARCQKRTYKLYDEKAPRRPGVDNVETHFLQVCVMRAGSCFNLGENFGTRTVIALTPVTCMICPHYWIFQNNEANIWNRVVSYLNATVPTTEELFQDFVQERRWLCYKRAMVMEITTRKPRVNKTSMMDVPYSLRMNAVYPPDRPGYTNRSSRRLRFSVLRGELNGTETSLGQQPLRTSHVRSSVAVDYNKRSSSVASAANDSLSSNSYIRRSLASGSNTRSSLASGAQTRSSLASRSVIRNSIASFSAAKSVTMLP